MTGLLVAVIVVTALWLPSRLMVVGLGAWDKQEREAGRRGVNPVVGATAAAWWLLTGAATLVLWVVLLVSFVVSRG